MDREAVADAIWTELKRQSEDDSLTAPDMWRVADAAIAALDAARSEHLPTDDEILGSMVLPGGFEGRVVRGEGKQ